MATPTKEDKRVESQLKQVVNYINSAKKIYRSVVDGPDFRNSVYNQNAKYKKAVHDMGIHLTDAYLDADKAGVL